MRTPEARPHRSARCCLKPCPLCAGDDKLKVWQAKAVACATARGARAATVPEAISDAGLCASSCRTTVWSCLLLCTPALPLPGSKTMMDFGSPFSRKRRTGTRRSLPRSPRTPARLSGPPQRVAGPSSCILGNLICRPSSEASYPGGNGCLVSAPANPALGCRYARVALRASTKGQKTM